MKAVNLLPAEARRGHSGLGAGSSGAGPTVFGPAQVVIAVLVILVALIALRVLADNHLNDDRATLAAAQTQVATEQAQASRLTVYTSFVQAAQQREGQVRDIAEQRFPWQRTLDQISHVLPPTTSLSSLSATTSGLTTVSTGTASSAPTFALAGCADTPDQTGTATLLRRLRLLTGVTNVNFQSSAREASCGNSFSLTLGFTGAGTSSGGGSSTAVASTPAATTATATPATTQGAAG